MNREKVIVASASYLLIHLLSKKRKPKKSPRKRRWWISSIFRNREVYIGKNPLRDLRVDNLHFKTFCRVSPSDFDTILNLVGPKIAKKGITFRKSVIIIERLAITLRYLASGDSFTSLSFSFKVSKQTISTGDRFTSSAPDPDFPGVASF
nr:unnamed protein product [Callosobruchus analis]